MPIEIPFMSTNFGMFTQFIYEHITIYRNLTPNIPKGQRRVKKGSKIGEKMANLKNAYRNTIYEFNFWHVYTVFTCVYYNIQEFDHKYNQGSKWVKEG